MPRYIRVPDDDDSPRWDPKPEKPMVLYRGPVAYLNRTTGDGRRITNLNLGKDRWPLPVCRLLTLFGEHDPFGSVIGRVVRAEVRGDEVWADVESNRLERQQYAAGIEIGHVNETTERTIDGDVLNMDGWLMSLVLYQGTGQQPAWPDCYIAPVE